MKKTIYLDYAATTPVDPRVAAKMTECLTMDGNFGNPASRSHIYGWRAEEAVENARAQVAELINADPREIVWTSGATESNNLAIKGAARARRKDGRGNHIVTSRIEHKAVLDVCSFLEQDGFSVTYLAPGLDGIVEPEQVASALTPETVLVSIMHANNEVGTINDIAAISAICREHDVLLHVDAAQSAGKIPIDISAMQVDLMSLSAHKFYGPKGIGALYVRRRPPLVIEAQIHGGGHERGMRSGTLATHQVVGMGAASAVAKLEMDAESERILLLRNKFLEKISAVDGVIVNGDLQRRLPGNLNLSVADVDGEALLLALKDIAISSGSACTSASLEPSYVLRGMGIPDALAQSALRFSFGRFTTDQDVDAAADLVLRVVPALRAKGL
ncbi:MAG TPA: IscS subfamily cysteine desulfurase [Spongiibacteraceae bacterium]|nr:IscS subfamily cysteine desulfurase [Spongiibacteraceae bacterium]